MRVVGIDIRRLDRDLDAPADIAQEELLLGSIDPLAHPIGALAPALREAGEASAE